jgi:hypothetical protein
MRAIPIPAAAGDNADAAELTGSVPVVDDGTAGVAA